MISIILPSIRPKSNQLALDSIRKSAEGLDYEIINPTHRGVFYEIVNQAYSEAKGEYIILTSDDAEFIGDSIKNMYEFMNKQKPLTIGTFIESRSERRGTGRIDMRPCIRCGKLIGGYIMVNRHELLEKWEYLLDPEYSYFNGEIDLSLRVWDAGGQVLLNKEARVLHDDIHDDWNTNAKGKYLYHDNNILRSKFVGAI